MSDRPPMFGEEEDRPPYSGWVRFNSDSYRYNFGPTLHARRVYARGRGYVWLHDLRVGDYVAPFTSLDPPNPPYWIGVREVGFEDISRVLDS